MLRDHLVRVGLSLFTAAIVLIASATAAYGQDQEPPKPPTTPTAPTTTTPDLPIATDNEVPPQQQQQQQPQQPQSVAIAAGPEPPAPPSTRSDSLMVLFTFGLGPVIAQTPSLGGTNGGTDLGGLGGFRAYLAGVTDLHLSVHVDVEARLGVGSDGFLTRDRAAAFVGGNTRIADFGALSLRAGGEVRYFRSGIVEYGRLLAPAAELSVYRFGSRGSEKAQFELAAIGGLAAYTSLHANDDGVVFDRSLAFGTGGSLTIGSEYLLGRVSYLRAMGSKWAGDVDVALCAGRYIVVCGEFDHVMVQKTEIFGVPDGSYATWRALLSLGFGVAWAE